MTSMVPLATRIQVQSAKVAHRLDIRRNLLAQVIRDVIALIVLLGDAPASLRMRAWVEAG